jgi:protein-tyrosine phosphatase
MIDLHCHILPGVDDGSADVTESVRMARGLFSLGFRSICCTPHASWRGDQSEENLNLVRSQLSQACDEAGILLSLHSGAEHHSLDVLEKLAQDQLICYPRKDSFLLEFPLGGFPPRVFDLLFRIQIKDMLPVLAHVERYLEVQKDIHVLHELKERGCRLLVNLTSLGGRDRSSKLAAQKAIATGLVDGATTDLHEAGDLFLVEKGLEELLRLVGEKRLTRLMVTNPAAIAGIGTKTKV